MSSVAPLPSLFQMPTAQGGLLGDLAAPTSGVGGTDDSGISFFGLVAAQTASLTSADASGTGAVATVAPASDAVPTEPELAPERAAGSVDLASLLATTEALDGGRDAAATSSSLSQATSGAMLGQTTVDLVGLPQAGASTSDASGLPAAGSAASQGNPTGLQALLDLLQAVPTELNGQPSDVEASPAAEAPAAAAVTAKTTTEDTEDTTETVDTDTTSDATVSDTDLTAANLAADTAAFLSMPMPQPQPQAIAPQPAEVDTAVAEADVEPEQRFVQDAGPVPVKVQAPDTDTVAAPSVDVQPALETSATFTASAPADDQDKPIVTNPVAVQETVEVEALPVADVSVKPTAASEKSAVVPASVTQTAPEEVVPVTASISTNPPKVSAAAAEAFASAGATPETILAEAAAPAFAPVPASEPSPVPRQDADTVVPQSAPDAGSSVDADVAGATDLVQPAVAGSDMPDVAPEVTDVSAATVATPPSADRVDGPAVVSSSAGEATVALSDALNALKAMPSVEQVSVVTQAAPTRPTDQPSAVRPAAEFESAGSTVDIGDAAPGVSQAPDATASTSAVIGEAVAAAPEAPVATASAAQVSSLVTPAVSDATSVRRTAVAGQTPLPSAKVAVARLAVDEGFQAALDALSDAEVTVSQSSGDTQDTSPAAVKPQQTVTAATVAPVVTPTPAATAAVAPAVASDVSLSSAMIEFTDTAVADKVPAPQAVAGQVQTQAPQVVAAQVQTPTPQAASAADAGDVAPLRPTPAVAEAPLPSAPATVDAVADDTADVAGTTFVSSGSVPEASAAVRAAPATTQPIESRPAPAAAATRESETSQPAIVTNPAQAAPVATAATGATLQGQSPETDGSETGSASATAAATANAAAASTVATTERRSNGDTSSSSSTATVASNGAATGTSAFGLAARKTVTGVSNAAKAFVERLRQGTQDSTIQDKGSDTGTTNLAGLTGSQQTANAQSAPATAEASGAGSSRSVPIAHVGAEIVKHATNGETSFSVRLHPEELGRIDVKLDFGSDGTAKAHLTVERSDTYETLSRDQRQIEQTLRDAGFSTRDGAVSLSLRQDGSGDRPNQGQWNQQQGENRQRYYTDTTGSDADASASVATDVYRGRRDALVDIQV